MGITLNSQSYMAGFSEGCRNMLNNGYIQVVRCKECKHTPRSDSNDYWCDKWEREFGSDWFCADGERNEEKS